MAIKFVIIPTSEVTNEMRSVSEIEIISKGTPGKTILNYYNDDKPSALHKYEGLTDSELSQQRQEEIKFWWGQEALDFENKIKELLEDGK
mgnify:CR=1 FL=1